MTQLVLQSPLSTSSYFSISSCYLLRPPRAAREAAQLRQQLW
eukprot:SM006411S19706  [mRNA]  locus=s6411:493:618:+ [translate_table: standard]